MGKKKSRELDEKSWLRACAWVKIEKWIAWKKQKLFYNENRFARRDWSLENGISEKRKLRRAFLCLVLFTRYIVAPKRRRWVLNKITRVWSASCKRIRNGYGGGGEAVRMKRKQIYTNVKGRRSQTGSVRDSSQSCTSSRRRDIDRSSNEKWKVITKGREMTEWSRTHVLFFSRTFVPPLFHNLESPPWKLRVRSNDRKRDRVASTDVYAFMRLEISKCNMDTWRVKRHVSHFGRLRHLRKIARNTYKDTMILVVATKNINLHKYP